MAIASHPRSLTMCNYCGCRNFAEVALLSEQHDEIINESGELRRAVTSDDATIVDAVRQSLGRSLTRHTDREELGLFRELQLNPDVAPHIAELCAEHDLLDEMLAAVHLGDVTAYERFEAKLRHHIDREENGLFPAAVIELDPSAWPRIVAATESLTQ